MAIETRSARTTPARADRGSEAQGLDELLDQVDAAAAKHERTSVADVLESVGTRSFAPILLVAGLVMLTPIIGDIPGVPVLMGLIVILVAGQLLLRRQHIWLPRWLLRRAVAHDKLTKTVRWLRKPARVVDRWSKPRYTALVRHAGAYVIAVAAIVIAAATPLMEVIPFSANIAGVAITAFGIALIVQDGLVALLAIAFSFTAFVLVAAQFL